MLVSLVQPSERVRLVLMTLVFGAAMTCGLGFADDAPVANTPDPAAVQFFENKIRPILVAKCYKCHGDEKQKGGLRLDGRAVMMTGGDSGPAIELADADESPLLRAIRYSDPGLQMPPDGRLADDQIADLERWVKSGAVWPGDSEAEGATPKRAGPFQVTEQDRQWWSFQPIQRPEVPDVKDADRVHNPIDAFVQARLDQAAITPNGAASPRQLIRRLYFDLIGLPPSPDAVAKFEADPSPAAYSAMVEELLSSPQYGERWGRHWLDVVRYAQSDGYERDSEKPLAWKYRDYVVKSFNDDKPFDQFVREQLAGDLIAPESPEAVIATGFYRLGVWDDEPADKRQAVYDELDDMVSTVGSAFLGLTIGCARCHDHKFDPISQRDYYEMLAFMHRIRPYERPRMALDSATFVPLASRDEIAKWEAEHAVELTAAEEKLKAATDDAAKAELQKQYDAVKAKTPPFEFALAARDQANSPQPVHILIRGNADSPGAEVTPGYLDVLQGPDDPVPEPGRRALADWITRPEHPLTARVIVNRVWQHHFGRGLAPMPNDLGKTGQPPSHPELLDWLASEFLASGYRIKQLHRWIVHSATYQRSTATNNESGRATDESNVLLWRQNLRRLDAEALRDSILAVSGELDLTMGGRGVFPRLNRDVLGGQSRPGLDWTLQRGKEANRRSIYLFIKRTLLVPMMEAFDYNITATSAGDRQTTTVAPQSLILLNSDFMQEQAGALAHRLRRDAGADRAAQIRLAYRLSVGREPTEAELATATNFIERQFSQLTSGPLPVTLRPETPESLSSHYFRQMLPSEFVSAPAGWDVLPGRWAGDYAGIRTVDKRQGPFVLSPAPAFRDGSVELELQPYPAAEMATVLIRAVERDSAWDGYEAAIEPPYNRLLIRKFSGSDITELGSTSVVLNTGEWLRLRVIITGKSIQVFLRDETEPRLVVTDESMTDAPGRVGFRTWGAMLAIRSATVASDAGTNRLDPTEPMDAATAEAQSLSAFCLLVLNLNEFAYVD